MGTNLLISSTVYLFRASPGTAVARQSPCKLPVSIQPYKPPQAAGEAAPIKANSAVMNCGRKLKTKRKYLAENRFFSPSAFQASSDGESGASSSSGCGMTFTSFPFMKTAPQVSGVPKRVIDRAGMLWSRSR